MPYPNEHSARLKSPGEFKRFRRQNEKFGAGIDAIFGITDAGKAIIQAIRFAKDKFSVDQAKKWLKGHGYNAIKFEAASTENMSSELALNKGIERHYPTVVNLTGGGLVREDKLEGKDCYILPAILIVEGVHNGSRGPILYQNEELARTAHLWNATPVVIYHPSMDGKPSNAGHPEVFNKFRVGHVFNARFEDGKTKAEVWIEKDRLDKVDKGLIVRQMIENNSRIELSTGLFSDDQPVEGIWNGEKYVAITSNHIPDHLAILPDVKGACSWEDGGGMPRLNQENDEEGNSMIKKIANALHRMMNKNSSNENKQPTNGGEIVERDEQVNALINDGKSAWEESDREFLTNADEKVFKKIVETAKNQKAEAPAENDRKPVQDASDGQDDPKTEKPAENAEEGVNNASDEAQKPKTVEEFLTSEEIPEEIRKSIANSHRAFMKRKAELVEGLIKNEKCKLGKEMLESKDVEELELLTESFEIEDPTTNKRTNYALNAQGEQGGSDKEEPLGLPTMNWDKKED